MGVLHNFHSKFDSVTSIRAHIKAEFSENVPQDNSFSVGYFNGKNKLWILNDQDVNGMYLVLRNDMEICLWCDGLECQDDEGTSITVKKSSKKEGSSIQKGQQLDDVFEELRKKHSKSYSIPLLRLWARVVTNGLHESMDKPPDLPQFKSEMTSKNTAQTMSPCKVADTRTKYIEQLRQVKALFEENVLSNDEYEEQKEIILCSLRKLK